MTRPGRRLSSKSLPLNLRTLLRAQPSAMAGSFTRGKWKLAPHLKLLSHKISEMHERPLRLMVFMPPRHGKSELCSCWTPTWFLTNWPDKQVILASYEADFATTWGRKVRGIVEERGSELGISLSQESKAANRWNLKTGGGMLCAGVGGAITGRGADLLIVDDPIKNAEEAASVIVRDKVYDWWKSTAWTRLEPGASVILIMTRWHESDLAASLLKDDIAEGWDVISFPAFAEDDDVLGRSEGDALWPIRYDTERLDSIQKAVGMYWWSAMYQQRPAPYGGGMLQRNWFDIVDSVPSEVVRVRWWDLAATEKKGNQNPDYTVGALVGFAGGIWYIIDIRRVRSTPRAVEKLIKQTAELDGLSTAQRMEQEPGSSGINTIDHYMRNILPGVDFKGHRTTGSKIERARPLSSAAEANNVKLVRGSWNEEFLLEAELFPAGSFDDQVDGVSGAMQELALMPGFFPYDIGADINNLAIAGNAFGVMEQEF